MEIHIKRLVNDAILPKYGRDGDAGLDLYTTEEKLLQPGERYMFSTGIAFAIPKGTVGLIWDRSGLAGKHGLTALGGVLDHTYRGEIKVVLLNTSVDTYHVKKGDRIAQLLIQPIHTVTVVEKEVIDETVRSDGGFGSSGR